MRPLARLGALLAALGLISGLALPAAAASTRALTTLPPAPTGPPATPAGAGAAVTDRDVSYSTWTLDGSTVYLRFEIPDAAARALAEPGKPAPTTANVAAAIAEKLSASINGEACPIIEQGAWAGKVYTLAPLPGMQRFEVIYDCPQAQGISLSDKLLFDVSPAHIDYAKVQLGQGRPVLETFTKARQTLSLPAAGEPRPVGFTRFLGHGAERILKHLDRLALFAGLLMICRRWRDLGAIAVALAGGYAAALIVSSVGTVMVDQRIGHAVIGLIVGWVAVNGLRAQTEPGEAPSRTWRIGSGLAAAAILVATLAAARFAGRAEALAAAGVAGLAFAQIWVVSARPSLRDLAFGPAAAFGFLDGMGLTGDLAQLQLPLRQTLAPALGDSIGALAAGLALAAVGMAALWLLKRRAAATRALAADLAGAGLLGLGLFLFVSRLYI